MSEASVASTMTSSVRLGAQGGPHLFRHGPQVWQLLQLLVGGCPRICATGEEAVKRSVFSSRAPEVSNYEQPARAHQDQTLHPARISFEELSVSD